MSPKPISQTMIDKCLVVTILLALPGLAGAATWVEIGGNESVIVLVEKDSVRRNGSRVKSWLKWEWSKPTDVPNSYPIKMYLSEKQLQVSDCQNNTLAVAQGIRYADSSGSEVVDSYTIDEKAWHFSEAVPETIGESIVKFVCKATATKKK
ncbi:MAG: hypothetical protein Q7T07_12120 [Burkholderiaceae bacterium]|nr:hypothetical protein [Burkholderiaceae bacterium]